MSADPVSDEGVADVDAAPMALDPAFVALLCCPNCASRPRLSLRASADALDCTRCGRVYPIVDGLPDLRPDNQKAPAPAAQHD